MRWAAYAGASTVLASGVVLRAFHQRANFYSACVYLSQSSACLMILTNLLLICVCAGMLGLQRLLYGPLRPIEIEQLYEKAWFAITETCLAMTIFRDEVGGWFLVMFVSLLVGKVWGWIGEGRVEILEQQPPTNPRLFHARLIFSLLLSLAFDSALLHYTTQTVLRQARPNMMVMFAFEFAVLTLSSSSTTARYAISLTEAYIIRSQTQARIEERRIGLRAARAHQSRQDDSTTGAENGRPSDATISANQAEEIDEGDIDVPGWEEKGQWMFYLDLLSDFLKLTVYVSFFTILLTFYGLPLHIMRDLFLTFRSFTKRVADYLRYRNATRDMNARYPDATQDEVAREDVCIVCREEMRAWAGGVAADGVAAGDVQGERPTATRQPGDERLRPKKLPCGHILHFGCLRSWLERQQICPTCRRSVMVPVEPRRFPTNPGANAPDQRQPPQGMPAPAARRPIQGRMFRFGPIRIGFGVGMNPQDLARHIHDGPEEQAAGGDEARENNDPNRQQFGFGIAFGRQRRNVHHQNGSRDPGQQAQIDPMPLLSQGTGGNSTQLQMQILALENLVNREIRELNASANQLRVVRRLHDELERLRGEHNDARQGDSISSTHPSTAAEIGDNPLPFRDPSTLRVNTNAMVNLPYELLRPDPSRQELGPGHPDLPSQLSLPDGWTLLPLRKIEPGQPDGAPTSSIQPHPEGRGRSEGSASSTKEQVRSGSAIRDTHTSEEGPPDNPSAQSSRDVPESLDVRTSGRMLPLWSPPSSQRQRSDAEGDAPDRKAGPQEQQARQSQAKGKDKATTVEDYLDDSDW
ncbi:MAG: hypothetical protein M1825_006076 [Sarcosagium campestre]|nr:MAG: hypothetical protein M1825_006076 [Sarcosagium campestre]